MNRLNIDQRPIWTPSEISTFAWWDASDMSTIVLGSIGVSNWKDKSGNVRNAIQNSSAQQPLYNTRTFNGLKAIEFNGTNKHLQMASSFNLIGKEVWAVISPDSLITNNFCLMGHPAINSQVYIVSNAGGRVLRLWSQSNPYVSDLKSTTTFADGSQNIIGWLAHTDTKKFSINGVLETKDAYVSPRTLDIQRIGASRFETNSDGILGELIVTAGILTTQERYRMEGYLAWKWGMQANLPANHIYKNTRPAT